MIEQGVTATAMTEPPINEGGRIADVLTGFPDGAGPDSALAHLARLSIDLDALGRLDPATGAPLVDRHTFATLLTRLCGRKATDHMIECLEILPGCAFRPAGQVQPPAREVPWFALTRRVVILDGMPPVTFADLTVPTRPTTADLVQAVHVRFPSMEPELLDPNEIPPRLARLLRPENATEFECVLRFLVHQLGWWAAFVAAVLSGPARIAVERTSPLGAPRAANVWPLTMFLLGAGIGGWTLTIVGSCILARPR